jgi:hypothetical protein
MTEQPSQPSDQYSRPAVAVALSGTDKMFALRMLRTVAAPYRIRRLVALESLWAHQADWLADWLTKAGDQARPLSRNRRHSHRLVALYRVAAETARTTPIKPAEWPEAPTASPAPLTWDEAAATARWGVVPPPV